MHYHFLSHQLGIPAEAVACRLLAEPNGNGGELALFALRFIEDQHLIGEFIQAVLAAGTGDGVKSVPLDRYRDELLTYWPVDPGDEVNTYLRETFQLQEEFSNGPVTIPTRPYAFTRDGTYLSIQADAKRSCEPSSAIGPYTDVEVGYPSIPLLDGLDTDGSIYYHVPVSALNDFLKAHGGLSLELSLTAHRMVAEFDAAHEAADSAAGVKFSSILRRREGLYREIGAQIAAGKISESKAGSNGNS